MNGIPSIFNQHRDFGVIEQCPHCDKTNIVRMSPNQITCGAERCRNKQNDLRRRIRKERQL